MNDLEKIKNGERFAWGHSVKWYEIGPYTILEFNPWVTDGNRVLHGSSADDVFQYHGWIDGKDMHESWPTLETCIAGLIGLKYAGLNNGGVGYYFCKMVDAPPYDKQPHIKEAD